MRHGIAFTVIIAICSLAWDLALALDMPVISKKGKTLALKNVRFGYSQPLAPGNTVEVREPSGKSSTLTVGSKSEFVETGSVPMIVGHKLGVQLLLPEIDPGDGIDLRLELQLPPAGGNIKVLFKNILYTFKDSEQWRLFGLSFRRESPAYRKTGEWTFRLFNGKNLLTEKNITVYKPALK